MKKKYKRCRECPFAKNSARGYLGELSYQPEEFIQQIEIGHMQCHMSVNWNSEEPDYSKSHECVGTLQFMNNSCKKSKFEDERELQLVYGKNDEVFNWRSEFIKHHTK